MAYTTSWDGSGGRPRGRAALGQGKKGWSCALIIWPPYAPAALAADWLEAQLLLAPSTLKELLASTYADVVLMFTDWFPLEWIREERGVGGCGVLCPALLLPFVNELALQVQEVSCNSCGLCWNSLHSAVLLRADWIILWSESDLQNISKCNLLFMSMNGTDGFMANGI